MADSDQLPAPRIGQASADMRGLIKALASKVNWVSDLVTRPGEPTESVEIPAAYTIIEDSGDDVEEIADSESTPEQVEEPKATPVSVAEVPVLRASIWSHLVVAQASDEAPSVEEPEVSESGLDKSASHDTGVPEAETSAVDAAAPVDETDAAPQGEAPADEAPTAPMIPDLPRRQCRRHVDEAKASSRPPWHSVSFVPADSPAGRVTHRTGTGTYKLNGIEKSRQIPVFESERKKPRFKVVLLDWDFSVSASYDVCVVNGRSGLRRDDEASKATAYADGCSIILVPGPPDDIPVGPIPEEEATQTGIPRRAAVWPTVMGAIPIAKRR